MSGSPSGFSPQQIKKAYGFDQVANQGEGQTIAIVDAYDDPAAEADLEVFSTHFGLPPCSSQTGCFKKLYSGGAQPMMNPAWAMEISLDIQWAHAIAPRANILLIEASTSSLRDLLDAVDQAVQHGAAVVSMSWGANEFYRETSFDSHFNVHSVVFTASSGDTGHGVEYPAAAANVVGIGGTTLQLDASGEYAGETAWRGSGGGISLVEAVPDYQSGVNNQDKRTVPDVAYNADPRTGYAIYNSAGFYGWSGWFQAGGTSAGTPQWAALFAIADSMRAAAGKLALDTVNTDLYRMASGYRDVLNGAQALWCGSLCSAGPGYDLITGLGSPRADRLIAALTALP